MKKNASRIAINADSIATWALPALTPLAQQGLPMEIITDDQDFTQEWLREGQVLGCVTTLKQALRGCKITPLGAMDYVAVASPELAQTRLNTEGGTLTVPGSFTTVTRYSLGATNANKNATAAASNHAPM